MARALRYKCIGYGVITLVLFLLQSISTSPIRVLGQTPELMLLLSLAVAFREREVFAGWFGLICGFLSDMARGGSVGLHAIFYMFLAYFLSVALQTLFRPLFLSYIAISMGAMVLMLTFEYLFFLLLGGQLDFVSALIHTCLPRLLLTGVWGYAVYYIVYRYNLSMRRRRVI